MKILAIDSAMGACSVAVAEFYDENKPPVVYSRHEKMMRGQAEKLVPMVNEVMDESGFEWSDIGLVASTVGPGAFTGIRVGLASARGFGISLDVPVIGVTTMEALAYDFLRHSDSSSAYDFEFVTVVVETRRKDFYYQIFDISACAVSEPASAFAIQLLETVNEKGSSVFIGDACKRLELEAQSVGDLNIAEGHDMINAAVVAEIAYKKHKSNQHEEAVPLYLGDACVSFSNKKQKTVLGV